MPDTLGFKPDFARSAERYEAWWHCEVADRPVVTLNVKPQREYAGPTKQHESFRDRWFDTEFVVDSAIAHMAQRDFAGDSLPTFNANMGPDITATPFGCELDYSEFSSWSTPIIHDTHEWSKLFDTKLNFDNPHWRHVEQLQDLAIEKCEGRYLVGMTDLHGNYDILAALRDPQMLCMDLLDCPDVIHRAGMHVADAFCEMFRHQYEKVAAAEMGSTCWLGGYHAGPAYVPSSDFWCMVSDETARDMVLPAIQREMQPLDRSIFHLDGPQALRHLDLLLELPELNAVQWVFGAGNGTAKDWLDVYRRCQAAGKAVQVHTASADEARALAEVLSSKGLWLQVGGQFDDSEQADAFLKEIRSITTQIA